MVSLLSGKPQLLITAAVAAGKATIDSAYEISEISKSLDFIHLMSYDLHGSWDPVIGHHSQWVAPGYDDPNLCVTSAVQIIHFSCDMFYVACKICSEL